MILVRTTLGLIGIAIAAMAAGAILLLSANPDRLDEIRRQRLEPLRVDLAARGLLLGAPVFIRIFKQESELELWMKTKDRFALWRTYPICKWSGALGPKQQEGDMQAPEGFYSVERSQMNPASQHHLSFNLGFPNAFDQAHGRTGSFLMVHGGCVSIGCYAMTDHAIEEIWLIVEEALKAGQVAFEVHAFPFKPSPQALALHRSSRWHGFWSNLAAGYETFEATRTPPTISIANGAYVIN